MGNCALCDAEPPVAVVGIAHDDRLSFALPSRIEVGTRCLELLQGGHRQELADRLSSDFEDPGPGVVVDHLARSVISTALLPPLAPAVRAAMADGFVPLREVTGAGGMLGPLWPEQHRLWLDELGPLIEGDKDEDDCWLVRSPWPALSVPDVLSVLWRWVERDPYPTDRAEHADRIREVLAWSQERARYELEDR
ncbi:MAG TPA: hypothetical protein VHZ06_04100 [Marmoricola sp.]|nr:hypothetical protein [Marmoricola sp.]